MGKGILMAFCVFATLRELFVLFCGGGGLETGTALSAFAITPMMSHDKDRDIFDNLHTQQELAMGIHYIR
jgi:hypothetical protein